jgi:Penicillin-insensitive murein endopeptidase
MRGFVVGCVVASGLLLATVADAKSRREPAKPQKSSKTKAGKGKPETSQRPRQRRARAARISTIREHDRDRVEIRTLAQGQSIGAPWAGRLQHPTLLPPGDGYVIRRPQRAFGTETTVELIERAVGETLDAFPDEHVLAIGDISAESGGLITQHRSHQSGRDVDVGLFYNEQPADYPANFVHASEDNLDCAATFKLLESFLATTDEDGGVLMIFLDFNVQGILYAWAQDHGVSERRLARIFQYPHGRGSSEGLVRHEPNHDNHMHVRFKCPAEDTACQ